MAKHETSLPFILLLSFLDLIEGNNCSKSKLSKVTDCPGGWMKIPQTNSCVFLFKKNKLNWNAAKQSCEALDGDTSLFSPTPFEETKQFQYIQGRALKGSHCWVGMNDIVTEQNWAYTNGYTSRTNFWGKGEGLKHSGENCVFLNQAKKLADASCHVRRCYYCQKESLVGPRELEMDIAWHNFANKTLYVGYPVTITCSAFSPKNGEIEFKTSIPKSEMKLKTFEVYEKNGVGECGVKTVLKLTFNVTKSVQGVQCFSRPILKTEECPMNATRLAFCKNSGPLVVSDALRGPPTATMSYEGMPGSLLFDSWGSFKIECMVPTSDEYVPIWVFNQPDGSSEATSIHRSCDKRADGTWIVLGSLLRANKRFFNTTFSCFAAHTTDLQCDTDSPLCTTIAAIPMHYKNGEGATGPRDTHLEVRFHVKPNYVYRGRSMFARCSALDAYRNNLKWRFHKNRTNISVELSENNKFELENVEDDQHVEAVKKTSEISVLIDDKLQYSYLSCFADAYNHSKRCTPGASHLKYCASESIRILERPNSPDLQILYPNYPGAVDNGTNVIANCTITSVVETFALEWVLYKKYGVIIVDADDPIVKSNTLKKKDKHMTRNSVLSITMTPEMDGMSVGCFAYSVYLDGPESACNKDDVLCARARPFKVVIRTPDFKVKGLLPVVSRGLYIGILIGVLILLALITVFKCVFEEAPGEDFWNNVKKNEDKLLDAPTLEQQKKRRMSQMIEARTVDDAKGSAVDSIADSGSSGSTRTGSVNESKGSKVKFGSDVDRKSFLTHSSVQSSQSVFSSHGSAVDSAKMLQSVSESMETSSNGSSEN